jgi:hypothetical protein
MAVALVALFVALGGTAVAVTGGNFVLGQPNTADHQTALTSSGDGAPALAITNTGTSAGSVPLKLTAPAGMAPFQTNSTTKVAHLNADQLDGLDSTQLQRPLLSSCGTGTAISGIGQSGKVACRHMPYVIVSLTYGGPLPITRFAQITVPVDSGVQISFEGSGFAATSGQIGADVWVCPVVPTCDQFSSISAAPFISAYSYANFANVHAPFQSMFEWALKAGTYDIGISGLPGTESDVHDDYSLSVIGFPAA